MKIQRIDDNEPELLAESEEESNVRPLLYGATVEELSDYSQRVTLPDSLIKGGLTIVFRDPSQADLEFFEVEMQKAIKAGESQQKAMRRFGCRLCTQWGDRPGITLPEWDKLRGKASLAIVRFLSEFFPDPTA